jgi:hypothetical protein
MAWNISDIPSGLLYVPEDQLNYYLVKSLWLNELLRNCLSTYIKKPWISAWIFLTCSSRDEENSNYKYYVKITEVDLVTSNSAW